jgi:hypothetical protein
MKVSLFDSGVRRKEVKKGDMTLHWTGTGTTVLKGLVDMIYIIPDLVSFYQVLLYPNLFKKTKMKPQTTWYSSTVL